MGNLKAGEPVTIWNRNFICILLISFILSISHFCINPLIASYALHLGASAHIMGLLTGLFFGVAFSMRPVSGPVLTKFDKRKQMILVFFIGGAANIGYALFNNISAFIAFRLLHGLQYALVGTLTMTLAGDNIPKDKMASGMGIYGLSSSLSMAIAPTLGISILNLGTHLKNENFGFTSVFLFAAIISFLGLIPGHFLLPEKKTKEEILSTGAWYKNIASVHAIPMAVVMFFIYLGWSLYNVYIVEYAKELGISGISSFYTVLAIVLIVARPASGYLTDRFGLTRILFPSLIIMALSFIIIGSATTIGTMLIGAAVASTGFGAFQPALYSMCMLSETPLKRGVASNTLYIGIDVSLFLGPILGSMVYDMYNYSVMFRSASVVILMALVVFFLILPSYYRRLRELEEVDIKPGLRLVSKKGSHG
ncbi:MAG: MFS transporter [Deltaproteobacteria bacterium]|nr:MFS transporter [Deltaproteobacteria bacterium]